jgi:hypothetical protein
MRRGCKETKSRDWATRKEGNSGRRGGSVPLRELRGVSATRGCPQAS